MKLTFNLLELKGLLLFFKEIFQSPSSVGAVIPSSKQLAKNIAAQASQNNGMLLELGAGTGVITEALLQKGIPAEKIIVIERSKALADHLQQRYPNLLVINGDAQNLTQLLGEKAVQITSVVSSLPLRSLPTSIVQTIENELIKVLKPNNLFIQYTYSYKQDSSLTIPRLKRIYSKRIWYNIPPARVDVYRFE